MTNTPWRFVFMFFLETPAEVLQENNVLNVVLNRVLHNRGAEH